MAAPSSTVGMASISDEQPAAQPRQQNPAGIGKARRHHRRIAHDARADHAADHHRQAEAQAEDAQQGIGECRNMAGSVSRHVAGKLVKASFRDVTKPRIGMAAIGRNGREAEALIQRDRCLHLGKVSSLTSR